MTLDEAIVHARETAECRSDLCENCRAEHAQLADWLEELKRTRKECHNMENYKTIEVTFSNGHSAIWEAEKGEWDDYSYDGKVFIIKNGGAWVGIYNMSHVISVVVK